MKPVGMACVRVSSQKTYRLIGADGKMYPSKVPGRLGGNRKLKIYGLLDCSSALRWLAKGYYVANRVFFADEAAAVSAGYRPCGVCLPKPYQQWKQKTLAFA